MPACPHSRHTWSQKSEISLSMTTPLPETPGNRLLFLPFQFQLLAFLALELSLSALSSRYLLFCPKYICALLLVGYLSLDWRSISPIQDGVVLSRSLYLRRFWELECGRFSRPPVNVLHSEPYQDPLSLSEEKRKNPRFIYQMISPG